MVMELLLPLVPIQLANVPATLDTLEPHVILVTPTTMEVEHAQVSHITLWNRLKRYLQVCIHFQLVVVIQLVQAVVIAQLVHVPATLDTPEPHVILVPPTTMEVEHALVSHITLWNRLKRYLQVCIHFQLVIVI